VWQEARWRRREDARRGLTACGGLTPRGNAASAAAAEGVERGREKGLGVVGARHCLVALNGHWSDDEVCEPPAPECVHEDAVEEACKASVKRDLAAEEKRSGIGGKET